MIQDLDDLFERLRLFVDNPRAQVVCGRCQRTVRLRRDGQIPKHRASGPALCPWSDQKPTNTARSRTGIPEVLSAEKGGATAQNPTP